MAFEISGQTINTENQEGGQGSPANEGTQETGFSLSGIQTDSDSGFSLSTQETEASRRERLRKMERQRGIENLIQDSAEQVFGESAGFGLPTEQEREQQRQIQQPEEQVSRTGEAIGMPDQPFTGETISEPEEQEDLVSIRDDVVGAVRGLGAAAFRNIPGEQPGEEFTPEEDNVVTPFAQGVARQFADFGSIAPGIDSDDALDVEGSDVLYGEDVEEFSNVRAGQEIGSIFGDVKRGDETSGLEKLGYGALGFTVGALDAFGGGVGDDAAKYTLKYADDTLSDIIGGARGSAGEIAEEGSEAGIKDILRGSAEQTIPDDAQFNKLASQLADDNTVDDVVKDLDRYEGFTRAANDTERIVSASDQDVEDLVNASSADEVDEVLTRSDNDLNRLFSGENADDVRSGLVRADSADDVESVLRKGAQDSLATRGFTGTVKKSFPKVDKVAGQRIIRSTDELYREAERAVSDDIGEALNYVKNNSDDKAVARGYALIDEFNERAKAAQDVAERQTNYNKAAEIANDLGEKLTEQGRSIQAAAGFARLDPAAQLKTVQQQISKFNEGVPAGSKAKELTEEETQYILEEAEQIKKMDNKVAQARRQQKLQNYINQLTPSSWIDRINQVWRSGLLTSLKTSGFNLMSTTGNFVAELAKDIPATVVDAIRASITGTDRTTALALPSRSSIREGFAKGFDYLETGFDQRNVGQRLDKGSVSFGKGKVGKAFQAYTDGVFRLMGAQDQPFYYGALNKSLRSQAKARAINKGLSGAEKRKFVDDLVENPTEEMVRHANSDASQAVFQNKTKIGEVLKGMRNAGDSGVGKFFIPFATTPAAAGMQVVKYSPLGGANEIFKTLKSGSDELLTQMINRRFDPGEVIRSAGDYIQSNPKQFAENIGRSLTGTGALALGHSLYDSGQVSLKYPENDQRAAELAEVEGKSFNAIRIGDKWYPSETFGPLGGLIVVGGAINRNLKESGSVAEATTKSLLDFADIAQNASPLPGLFDAAEALNNPETYGKQYVGRLVGGFVPNVVQDIAAATDESERQVTSDSVWEEVTEQVKKGIPGLRQQLQPKVDVLGNVRETQGIGEVIDPRRFSQSTETQLTQELRRLSDQGFEVSPTMIGGSGGYDSLTDAQNVNLVKTVGDLLRTKLGNAVSSNQYQQMSDEKRAELIDSFARMAKNYGRAQIAMDATLGIKDKDELRTKLKEMSEDNVLTDQVREMYMGLGGAQIIENAMNGGNNQ